YGLEVEPVLLRHPLLQIATGLAHSSDDPIDIDSESNDFTGGETEEETEAEVSES
ncbi:hypothetical protein KI387_036017, partial [Taxus chinensis]